MRRSNEIRPVRKIKSVIDGKSYPGGESIRGNSEQLKKQAGNHMVVLLQNWKSREKRYKIYRAFLSLTLLISCLSLTGLLYYYIDSSIP